MVKETLEEAAERLFPVFNRSTPFGSKYPWTPHKEREAFKKGAKYQAERMYSEEDLKQFAWQCVANFLSNRNNKVEQNLVEVIIDRNNLEFDQFGKK